MTLTVGDNAVSAGSESDFEVGERRLVFAGECEIGVFRLPRGFVAYENVCPHQGGPVCSGRIFPRLRQTVDTAGRRLMEVYDRDEPHLVCPWHGWEYDLSSGEMAVGSAGDIRLQSFPVRVVDGEVIVDVG